MADVVLMEVMVLVAPDVVEDLEVAPEAVSPSEVPEAASTEAKLQAPPTSK